MGRGNNEGETLAASGNLSSATASLLKLPRDAITVIAAKLARETALAPLEVSYDLPRWFFEVGVTPAPSVDDGQGLDIGE